MSETCVYDISRDVGMPYMCGHPDNKGLKCGNPVLGCTFTQSPFRSFWTKWDKRYMNLAKDISAWSKDFKVKVGAVVVDDYYVRGVGYNGFPRKVDISAVDKNKITVHAEVNAILAAAGKGHTLYVWPKAPCCSCASYIIQAGIKRVVLLRDHQTSEKWHPLTALQVLLEAGVKVSLLDGPVMTLGQHAKVMSSVV